MSYSSLKLAHFEQAGHGDAVESTQPVQAWQATASGREQGDGVDVDLLL